MTWSILTEGAPPEPSYQELLSGGGQPQPHAFLTRLCQELTGTTIADRKLVHETETHVETVRGFCGDPNVGYAWDSCRHTDDTALPMLEEYTTYGLPGAALIWSVAYRKRGQLGYATWTSTGLAVRLDEHARAVVDRLWAEVFGTRPEFGPAPRTDQEYENAVHQRWEQLRADLRSAG